MKASAFERYHQKSSLYLKLETINEQNETILQTEATLRAQAFNGKIGASDLEGVYATYFKHTPLV